MPDQVDNAKFVLLNEMHFMCTRMSLILANSDVYHIVPMERYISLTTSTGRKLCSDEKTFSHLNIEFAPSTGAPSVTLE